jgi:hypothetical protein
MDSRRSIAVLKLNAPLVDLAANQALALGQPLGGDLPGEVLSCTIRRL